MDRRFVRLISDSPFFGFGVCATLQRHYSFAVYSLHHDYREATAEILDADGMASELECLVVFHCRTPEHAPFLRRLLTHNSRFPIAVFFSEPNYELLELAALRQCISVFDETVSEEEFLKGVREASKGNTYFCENLGRTVVKSLTSNSKGPFTSRERDIISLMATGMKVSAVAAVLGVSPNTVKNHLASIYDKLGAGNRTAAVVKALEMGIIQAPRFR